MGESDLKHYNTGEIIKIIDGYKQLNENGRMGAFLSRVSGCRKCEGLPIEKRPLNRIVNSIDLTVDSSKEAERIEELYKDFALKFERKRYEPIDHFKQVEGGDAGFYQYVMNNFWPENTGLSIGVNGWTDASLLHSRTKPEIMLVGADWYPLRSQSTFLTEKDDDTFRNPGKFLSKLYPDLEADQRKKAWDVLLADYGIYFTNAMLCYRPQSGKVGNRNIAPESFHYCQMHLEEQIRIIKPKLIITWGLQPALSIIRYISSQKKESEIALKFRELVTSGFKFSKLGKMGLASPFQIQAEWGEFHFHPLCHPSMPNRWGKQDGTFLDYISLRKWLAERNMTQIQGHADKKN